MTTYLNEVAQNHVSVGLQDRERYEENEIVAVVIRPEYLPQTQNVFERKLALEGYQDPSDGLGKQSL